MPLPPICDDVIPSLDSEVGSDEGMVRSEIAPQEALHCTHRYVSSAYVTVTYRRHPVRDAPLMHVYWQTNR